MYFNIVINFYSIYLDYLNISFIGCCCADIKICAQLLIYQNQIN